MVLAAALALSGLPETHFNGELKKIFKCGTVLLKKPSPVSISRRNSTDSGISIASSNSEATLKNLTDYVHLITEIEERFMKEYGMTTVEPVTITYVKRNILDLASNISLNWEFQPAKLSFDTESFFENQSQYSRLSGGYLPPHVMLTCQDPSCDYQEPQY